LSADILGAGGRWFESSRPDHNNQAQQSDSDAPPIWYDPAVDDSELVPLDDADWVADLAAWEEECASSRLAAAAHELDDTGLRRGEPCSLRWIYVHMIEEYARHNGHADLIREMVDGAVGW
jgi:Protein of unknown function (DUF664)